MKLLIWNIRQGGGTRLTRITQAIAAHSPDVIALTEFRSRPGQALVPALQREDRLYVESTSPTGADNGICVISRVPTVRARTCPAPTENITRWLDVDFPDHGFGIGILHILCSVPKIKDGIPGEAKTRFWNAVLREADARLSEPFLFAGDFSTGAHRTDESGKTFVCAEHFCKLSALGWTDMWRHKNIGQTEWTWYSKLKGGARGNGFRLDHCFAAPTLRPRITSCRYSHEEREAGISDHSLMIVEVK